MKKWVLLCVIIIGGMAYLALTAYAIITEAARLSGILILITAGLTASWLFYHLWETREQKEQRDKTLICLLIPAILIGLVAAILWLFF